MLGFALSQISGLKGFKSALKGFLMAWWIVQEGKAWQAVLHNKKSGLYCSKNTGHDMKGTGVAEKGVFIVAITGQN